MRTHLVLVAVALAALAACKKDSGEPGAAAAFREPVIGKLTDAGFAVGKAETVDADDYDAKECVRTEVDRLEVLLCEYPTAEAAQENRSDLLGFGSGASGGATRTSGTIAMVVADRQNVDPTGARMKRLLATFSPEPKGTTAARRARATASN
jgi:hypothetical protein